MDNNIRRMTSVSATAPENSPEKKAQNDDYDSSDSGHSTLKNGSNRELVLETPGVKRMEAFARATKNRKRVLVGLAIAVYIVNWVYSQEQSTTYAYAIWATSSFEQHASGISATNIASRVISAVCLPFLAKFADVFSRPMVYLVALVCYTVGFIIIAQSPNISAYVVGNVLTAIGGSAITLLNSVLCADLVPLQWRGMTMGLLSTPYLATAWYTAEIASALGNAEGWRGYRMYAIIIPVVMGPALMVVAWLENRAYKTHGENAHPGEPDSKAEEGVATPEEVKPPFITQLRTTLQQLDAIGLILLGFGWSLLLIPFSLSSTAVGGYNNPSLIAMFVVGGILVLAYVAYEYFFAMFPIAPRRLLKNRTFVTAVIIDFLYLLAGYMQLTYVYSWVYIVTDVNDRNFVYYNNILTMTLCSCGVVAGVVHRITHRYKLLQIIGLVIKLIGLGLFVSKTGVSSWAQLVIGQVLVGIGGSFSVVGSQVASQACVPHQDVALVIALLSLWSDIGAAIGSAISVGVWSAYMPGNLRLYLPASVTDEEVAVFFGNIVAIKEYPFDSEIRQGAILAYNKTVFPLFAGALGLSFIPLIAACYQTNFYLGTQQNAYDNKDTTGKPTSESAHKVVAKKGLWQKIIRVWDQ